MHTRHDLTFFHAPKTRSTGVLTLLDELHADYDLRIVDMKASEQRSAAYRAINPMGKVPAILHGEALITEQVAIYLYLGDLYADAGLAPPIGDPMRGPYLRWMAFYGSCFEPALVDRALQREPAPQGLCPYGDFDTMFAALTSQLAAGPYMLGERFLALDVLWGTALKWMLAFKMIPEAPVLVNYAARIADREVSVRVTAEDAERAAALANAQRSG